MQPASPRGTLLFARDAVGAAAVEMPESQRICEGPAKAGPYVRGGRLQAARVGLTNVAHESGDTDRHRDQREQKDDPEQAHHHTVRDDGVEVGGPIGWRQSSRRRGSHDRAENHREAESGQQAVPSERDAERARPGVLLIGLQPNLRERLRHVDAELVRRRVLACIQALAAVVTEIREVNEVHLGERLPLFHRRKHRTVPVRSTGRRCTRSSRVRPAESGHQTVRAVGLPLRSRFEASRPPGLDEERSASAHRHTRCRHLVQNPKVRAHRRLRCRAGDVAAPRAVIGDVRIVGAQLAPSWPGRRCRRRRT